MSRYYENKFSGNIFRNYFYVICNVIRDVIQNVITFGLHFIVIYYEKIELHFFDIQLHFVDIWITFCQYLLRESLYISDVPLVVIGQGNHQLFL